MGEVATNAIEVYVAGRRKLEPGGVRISRRGGYCLEAPAES
jgi:hypothetical protein